MRVVTFDEFVKLPDGIVYSEYEPCIREGLYRRGRVLTHDDHISDFYYMDVLRLPDHEALAKDAPETSITFREPYWIRWGCFDFTQLFVVYDEPGDVGELITNLTRDVTGKP